MTKMLVIVAALAVHLVLSGCATVDIGSLERVTVAAYRDATAAVVLKGISRQEGAKLAEEADRLREQYRALALIKGLPQESEAVRDARAALLAVLHSPLLDGPAIGGGSR